MAYDAALRRQTSALPTNTVPALVVGHDGALWLGTALGLTRWRDGQFTRVPFDPALSFQGDAATLEAFFQAVAEAIFEARPVETVAQGAVSFVEAFGGPLRKADLIFSLVEAAPGHAVGGDAGGGLRRVEVRDGVPQDTLHLTRQDGLGSNVILALAVGAEGVLWVGTDEGLSRVQRARRRRWRSRNFAGLEGVPGPVREVAVDAVGRGVAGHGRGALPAAPGPPGRRRAAVAGRPRGSSSLWPATTRVRCPGRSCPRRWWCAWKISSAGPWWASPHRHPACKARRSFSLAATTVTDARGRGPLSPAVGQSDADLVVEVAAPARPQVAPVRFLAIIGDSRYAWGSRWMWPWPVTWCSLPPTLAAACRSLTCAIRRIRCTCTRTPPSAFLHQGSSPGRWRCRATAPMWPPPSRPGCTSSTSPTPGPRRFPPTRILTGCPT